MAKIPTLKHLPDVNLSLSLMLEAQLASEALTNEMETRIAKIRDEYAERLSGLNGDYQAEKKMVEAYLKAHKDDFEGPPRSVELAHGTVGFRLGQKHLKPISKWNWKKVLAALVADKAEPYLRRSVDVVGTPCWTMPTSKARQSLKTGASRSLKMTNHS